MIYRPLPPSTIPELVLTRWQVYKVKSNLWEGTTNHFVGYNLTEGYGRVSSAIVSYDKDQKLGVTESGRIYHLKGDSGLDRDADYVWGVWCSRNEITEIVTVSDTF